MRLLILLIGVIALPAVAAPTLSTKLGLWQYRVSNSSSSVKPNQSSEMELTRATGNAKSQLSVRIDWQQRYLPSLRVRHVPLRSELEGNLKLSRQLAGRQVASTANATGTLDIDLTEVALLYRLGNRRLSWDVGVNFNRLDTKLSSSLPGGDDDSRFLLTIPTLYLGAQMKFSRDLALKAEVNGLQINEKRLFTAMGEIDFIVSKDTTLFLGYRHTELDYTRRNVDVVMDFRGLVGGVVTKF